MQLAILNGPNRGDHYELISASVDIGRDSGCIIQIDDRKASRRHALIEMEGANNWVLSDLNSTNHTYLNGKKISKAILKEGDLIKIGRIEFQFIAVGQSAINPVGEEISVSMDIRSLQNQLRKNSNEINTVQGALYEISTKAEVDVSPREFMEEAMRIITDMIPCSAWVWIDWPNGREQPFRVSGNRAGKPIDSAEMELSRTFITKTVARGIGMINSESCNVFDSSLTILKHQISSAMAIPLEAGEGQLAVLYLDRLLGDQEYTREDLESVAILGSKLAMHLSNITLYRKLRSAYKDLENLHEEQLKNEKMAGVGRLASSFAHDLNNPLNSIIGFLQLAQRSLGKLPEDQLPEKLAKYIDRAYAASNYCRTLSSNLLTFAREDGTLPSDTGCLPPFSVKECVEATLSMIDPILEGGKAELTTDINDQIMLEGDPTTLQQVLMNLLTNAIDAMSEMPPEHERRLSLTASPIDVGMQLTISDTGPGIPEELRKKVFEALFTTKTGNRGTGLGLFVIKRIVEDSGGSIELSINESGGTTFDLKLPLQLAALSKQAQTESDVIDQNLLEGTW